jgi:alpha-glucosidase
VDVIKSIPAVWDDTIVLSPSEIGELAVYARRTGQTWFLAVMCGPDARHVRLPLSFLGDGTYRTALVRDAGDGSAVTVSAASHRRADTLALDLRAGGGFLARFSR